MFEVTQNGTMKIVELNIDIEKQKSITFANFPFSIYNHSYLCIGAVFFGVLCGLLGVLGLDTGAADALTVAVVVAQYFFGVANRLGDCRALLVVEGAVCLYNINKMH